jgi:hypothetical protein
MEKFMRVGGIRCGIAVVMGANSLEAEHTIKSDQE